MKYKAQQYRMDHYKTLSTSSSCFLMSVTVEENTTNFTHTFCKMYFGPFYFNNSTFLNVSSADSQHKHLNTWSYEWEINFYYWARKKCWQMCMPLTASLQQICNLMKCGSYHAKHFWLFFWSTGISYVGEKDSYVPNYRWNSVFNYTMTHKNIY